MGDISKVSVEFSLVFLFTENRQRGAGKQLEGRGGGAARPNTVSPT